VSSITLKPTQTHPADFGKVQDNNDTRDLAARLREVTKRPTEKHALPMTETQRVGWLHDMANKGMRADMHQRMFKGRGRYTNPAVLTCQDSAACAYVVLELSC